MNIKSGYTNILFIMLIIFSLFISGCELFQEGNMPQLRNIYNVMSIPTDGDSILGGGGGGGRGIVNILATTCDSSFIGGQCSGDTTAVYAVCSLKPTLDCQAGNKCIGPFSGSINICGGDYTAYGWGLCYCVGDGVCDTSYGEPVTSPDCAACTPGETQSCNLPQLPGTCGECNSALKTCGANNQWGSCNQVTFPTTEICDNYLDDDCDCSADLSDADCYYTHLECEVDSGLCVEVPGQGSNQDGCDDIDQTCSVYVEECGNNILDLPVEQCDNSNLNGQTCETINPTLYSGGILACFAAGTANECNFDLSGCIVACGDGVCEAGENCNYDRTGCQDRQCLEPTCLNGCGEVFVPNRGTDESCNNGYHCNGAGTCVINVCGDGYCDIGENPANCQADCSCSDYSCTANPFNGQSACGITPGCHCGNCRWVTGGGGGNLPPLRVWVCDCLNN